MNIIQNHVFLAVRSLTALMFFSFYIVNAQVFFSEYSEGSSTNKYLEIYNGTGADLDMAGYGIGICNNGHSNGDNPDPLYENLTVLQGTCAPGDVFVVSRTSADAAILAEADWTDGGGVGSPASFNGNDWVGLYKIDSDEWKVMALSAFDIDADDYYEKILDVFQSDTNIVGVQGLDRDLIESFQKNVRGKLMGWIWLSIENFFQHASIIKDKRSGVSPSLAVMHPIPDIDFCLESQWISTCAGVFKTNLFDIVEFPKGFVKYSWNEYLFFSYSIYKKKLGTMVYTSEPKYRNIQTDAGRLPLKDLVYMAEVYDLYIFSQLFNSNFSDRLIYLKSRLGRLLYNTLRTVVRREFNFKLIIDILGAFYFAFSNRDDIKKGDFQAYNQKFPID